MVLFYGIKIMHYRLMLNGSIVTFTIDYKINYPRTLFYKMSRFNIFFPFIFKTTRLIII